MPPGITRIVDPSQPQLRQENEQAISMKVSQLESGEGRAIYKNSIHDLRRYKRIQMFVHAEQPNNTPEVLADGDLALFLRIGSDYRHNYYNWKFLWYLLRKEGTATACHRPRWCGGSQQN